MVVVIYIYILFVWKWIVYFGCVCVCWLKIRRIEYMHRMGCLYKYSHARICAKKKELKKGG